MFRGLNPVTWGILALLCAGCEGKSTADAAEAGAPQAEAEAKADAKAVEAKAEPEELDLEALCIIDSATPLPATLPEACTRVHQAYDAFMTRVVEADPTAAESWTAQRAGQLKMTEMICTKNGSIEVAACQAHAFDHAAVQHRPQLQGIMRRCLEKFGAAPPPPG
jgi:hypothetical protein